MLHVIAFANSFSLLAPWQSECPHALGTQEGSQTLQRLALSGACQPLSDMWYRRIPISTKGPRKFRWLLVSIIIEIACPTMALKMNFCGCVKTYCICCTVPILVNFGLWSSYGSASLSAPKSTGSHKGMFRALRFPLKWESWSTMSSLFNYLFVTQPTSAQVRNYWRHAKLVTKI